MLFHFSETKAEVKFERLRCRCFLTELVRAVQVNVLSCDAIEKQKGTQQHPQKTAAVQRM